MISKIFSNAMSALNAFRTKMANTSHNIANMGTEGYHPVGTKLEEALQGGVHATSQRSELDGVELSSEVVDLMLAEHGFKANLAVIENEDERLQSVLDLYG